MRTLVLSVSLLLAWPVQAQPAADLSRELARGQQALAAQDYAAAHRQYARFGNSNPLAQFTLGLFEQYGWGRPANPVAACGWFQKAAAGNIPAAQQLFGDCLAKGTGRAVDGPAAVQWYRKAGAAGIANALCSAGDLYIAGDIVPRDVPQGLALCTAAAQAESPPAMLHLGELYLSGGAVPQDLVLARYWYDQAAQRHVHHAQFQLGIILSEGRGGDADPLKARFWFEHAAMEGYAPAYLPTAILYANAAADPATGALRPDDLARVYLWNSAARASTSNPVQLAEIARIDALVTAVMPSQWRPELNRKVAAHLARFAPSSAAAARPGGKPPELHQVQYNFPSR